MTPHRCWCGGTLGEPIGPDYRGCLHCGAAVLAILPGPERFDVSDDDTAFYGRAYWTEYAKAREFPDISGRSRSDLSERCLFWLDRVLEVVHPPGRSLEVGCGHGGFVRLMQELGFDASGTELSPWVVDFARRTFAVPVMQGRLEALALEPGFRCIAAFDVLEHLPDPLATIDRCADLLAPDGVLVLQTPWYRGEGPEWSMFQKDEHIHLFSEGSLRLLLHRAGFRQILLRPSFFPHDMWVVATRGPLPIHAADEPGVAAVWKRPAAFQALLDLGRQMREVRETLGEVEADRAARLADVEELTALLRESEAAREQSEADRAARLADVKALAALLRESEADRAAWLEQIHELTRLLRESESDRAARLEQIHELTRLLRGVGEGPRGPGRVDS